MDRGWLVGPTEILVSGGVAAILAAMAGGGMKAFGVELPILTSVHRQAMFFVTGLVLLGLGLFGDRLTGPRPEAKAASEAPGNVTAAAAPEAKAASATPSPKPSPEPVRAAEPQGTRIPPISGVQFIPAREILLRSGWSPIGQGNPMHNENIRGGNGPMFTELGFNEMVACAPTGLANCMFVYRSETGQVLHVSTLGEGERATIDNVRIVDCGEYPKPAGC